MHNSEKSTYNHEDGYQPGENSYLHEEGIHLSDAELLQRLANAQATSMSALGHNKSAMNERQADRLEAIAKERGLSIPPSLWRQGIFNGPGAV